MTTTPATTTNAPVAKDVASTTSHGTTTVADGVVAKIAGLAAREVPGVHALGNAASRAIGSIRAAMNSADHGQGISVEVGETQAAADITVIAAYPVPLQDVADGVRRAVVDAIETLVGLEVTEVNVTISDVHIPSDDSDDEKESRVQ